MVTNVKKQHEASNQKNLRTLKGFVEYQCFYKKKTSLYMNYVKFVDILSFFIFYMYARWHSQNYNIFSLPEHEIKTKTDDVIYSKEHKNIKNPCI